MNTTLSGWNGMVGIGSIYSLFSMVFFDTLLVFCGFVVLSGGILE